LPSSAGRGKGEGGKKKKEESPQQPRGKKTTPKGRNRTPYQSGQGGEKREGKNANDFFSAGKGDE